MMSSRSIQHVGTPATIGCVVLALTLWAASTAFAQTLDGLSAPVTPPPGESAAPPAVANTPRGPGASTAAKLQDIQDGVRVGDVFNHPAADTSAAPAAQSAITPSGPAVPLAATPEPAKAAALPTPVAAPSGASQPNVASDVPAAPMPPQPMSPQPVPALAQAASASLPPVVLNHPDVVDSAKLSANGQTVLLFGIVGLGGNEAEGLKSYIVSAGDKLTCSPQAGNEFACLAPDGTDLAMVALINGAAQSRLDAPAAYHEQEAAAQAARRGIWASLPPPPVQVAHPIVHDTATLEAARVTYRLDGIEGIGGSAARDLQGYIASQGDTLTCQQQGTTDYYTCLLPDGTDLAKAALVNGAARVAADATDAYRLQQNEAIANKRGIWATMAPAQVAVYESQSVPPPDAMAFVEEEGPASDGIAYVGGQPTAVVDGEVVFLAFAGAAGWGYYDHFHHWRGAPDRFVHHMERFHPDGRGLRGYGPGGFRDAHLRGDEFHREGVRPASFGRPGEFGRAGEAGRPGFGPRVGEPGGRPGFERPASQRPAFERPTAARPGFAPRPEMGRAEPGRPAFAQPPQANHFAAAQPGGMARQPVAQAGFNRQPTPSFGGARPGGMQMPARAAPVAAPRPAPAAAPRHK